MLREIVSHSIITYDLRCYIFCMSLALMNLWTRRAKGGTDIQYSPIHIWALVITFCYSKD